MELVKLIMVVGAMAVVVDRADLFFAEVSNRFRPVRDALVVIGLFYVTKKVIGLTSDVLRAVRVFGLSRLWSPDFRKKYGQWAVVTGCTRGIGQVYVDELAQRKLDIVLIGRSLPVLKEMAAKVESKHGVKTEVVVADFAAGPAVYEDIRRALESKDVGILVNNVGVIPEYPMFLTETNEEMLWDLVNVNVAACTLMCRIVLPNMEQRGRGAIINLASSAALQPLPLQAVYAATKAYVDYLSEALSYEVSSKGVIIQTVDPSYVCTGMTEFSDWLNKPSITVPSAQTFVSGAIRTLGVANRTTGYWAHSLQNYISGFVPRELYMYGSFLLNRGFRKEAMSKKAKLS